MLQNEECRHHHWENEEDEECDAYNAFYFSKLHRTT